ncbi:hypothetical protein [Paenibacillus odorifer]|uniref:hypothetical protein n=1 Tax=Paenibacillus odorifer TaxID=189426 RepID=UPI00096E5A33|nr:hypothetical protein [Paenibacillus odorifer]OMD67601.1 hypothetical protein BSK50_29980 [Paenibacillus odorifer]
MKRLFKVSWNIPYAKYESYVFGENIEDAMNNFNVEIQKEVLKYEFESISELPTDGVIVTKLV